MDDRGKTPVIRDQDARSLVSSHVGDIYTPDVPIFDPALFSGRRDDVEQFRRLLATPGTTIAIFGERGVGKTSLCNVVLHGQRHLRKNASRVTTVEQLLVGMLSDDQQHLIVSERGVKRSAGGDLGPSGPKIKADKERSEKLVPLDPETVDVNVLTSRFTSYKPRLDAIVIDEAQEIDSDRSRVDLATLAKAWADAAVPSALVLVGVASEMRPLTTRLRQYGGRNVHELAIEPLSRADAADIIAKRSHRARVSDPAAARVVNLADGYPWVLQRLMKSAIYAWVDRQSADAFQFPTTTRVRFFGKRIVQDINVEALGIFIDIVDVDRALTEFLNDLARHHAVDPTVLREQLHRPSSAGGTSLAKLSESLRRPIRPSAPSDTTAGPGPPGSPAVERSVSQMVRDPSGPRRRGFWNRLLSWLRS
jgi:hypothetical protein